MVVIVNLVTDMSTETATVNASATLTPLNELYKVARLAEGGEMIALHCAKMTEADMTAEVEHYNRTGKVRGPGSKIALSDGRETSFVHGFVECEGKSAVTMFGSSNLGKQVTKHGGLAALLKARFGYTGNAIASGSVAAVEIDPETRLKAIRDEEQKLMAIIEERKAKADEALNALVGEVQEFFEIDSETLKEVLKNASATDLASGMRAAKAFLA
jgi:hypothetical protein